jgi:phosphohistidine phosphatase SixA
VIGFHLLRHGDAGDPERWSGDDHLRPLSEKGQRQAQRLGRLLRAMQDPPDLFITSPKVRAAQTADIVAEAVGAPVVIDERLGGPLHRETVAQILLDAGHADRPCLVGHDPDFSDLLGELVGLPAIPMRKGAIARVDLRGNGPDGEPGILRYLIPPEVLPKKER